MIPKTLQEMYPEWDLIRANYKRYSFPFEFHDFNQEAKKCFHSQEQVLWKILDVFVRLSKFKDSFRKESTYQHPYGGMLLEMYSEKLDNSINFGIYEGNIFLETDIIPLSYLHKMTDEFWIRLMQLPIYGHFEFTLREGPVDKAAQSKFEKLTGNKSQLFNIIANFILLEADESFLSFGRLSVKWPIDIGFDKLFNNGYEVFKILYKTNYDLYRYLYQLEHGRSKPKK